MSDWAVALLFAMLVCGGLAYTCSSAIDCNAAHGALVKNAWGGLDCVPTVKP